MKFCSGSLLLFVFARVAELADARDSKSRSGNRVWVQLPPRAQNLLFCVCPYSSMDRAVVF